MSKMLQLAEIAQTLHGALQSLDLAGLPLTAALIDLAVNQVEEEMSKMDVIEAKLAAYEDLRYAKFDEWALRISR